MRDFRSSNRLFLDVYAGIAERAGTMPLAAALDESIDEALDRRAHVVQGDCIYGCRFCGIPEGLAQP